ncbi:MAG: hypothetical protein LRY71_00635 [Bacillaceae bacterium]|nr:hypothetical protein [Bacillaceae bacterium]
MISIKLTNIGEDYLLVVTGGTKHHIGATVVATFEEPHVHIKSIGLPSHKEEPLFIELAKCWCNKFQQTTVVTGGIHIDCATKEQIKRLVNQTWEQLDRLIEENMEKIPNII